MIPPPAQRTMSGRAGASLAEAPASHSIYVSKPDETAGVITQAAQQALTTAAASA